MKDYNGIMAQSLLTSFLLKRALESQSRHKEKPMSTDVLKKTTINYKAKGTLFDIAVECYLTHLDKHPEGFIGALDGSKTYKNAEVAQEIRCGGPYSMYLSVGYLEMRDMLPGPLSWEKIAQNAGLDPKTPGTPENINYPARAAVGEYVALGLLDQLKEASGFWRGISDYTADELKDFIRNGDDIGIKFGSARIAARNAVYKPTHF